MLKINIPTSPLPLWEHVVRSKKDILFITLESFTNIILSKLRFSSLRKFKRCFSKKSYLFGAANVKSQKGMILAGELQFYQFPVGISLLIPCCKRGNTTKPEMGAASIWHPPCSGESITNWRCNTHRSILLGQTGILRSLHWRLARADVTTSTCQKECERLWLSFISDLKYVGETRYRTTYHKIICTIQLWQNVFKTGNLPFRCSI